MSWHWSEPELLVGDKPADVAFTAVVPHWKWGWYAIDVRTVVVRFFTVIVNNPALGARLGIGAEVDPDLGAPQCKRLDVSGAPEGTPVTDEALQGLPPLQPLLDDAIRVEDMSRRSPEGHSPFEDFGYVPEDERAERLRGRPDAERFLAGVLDEGLEPPGLRPLTGPDQEQAYARFFTNARPARRGSPLTDRDLSQVAELHKLAVANGDNPIEKICETTSISRSQAYRRVKQARDAGLLRDEAADD